MGKLVSQAICAAAELKLADALGDEPRAADDLAAVVEAHPRSLYRLLRALSAVGIFTEVERGRFAHTPLSRALRADSPGSALAVALMVASEWHSRPWANLLHSIRTGETAFDDVYGKGMFDFIRTHPDAGRVFDAAMTSLAAPTNEAVLAVYDFPEPAVIVDVGGGQGTLLHAILRKYGESTGILFDSRAALQLARSLMTEARMIDRCTLVEGNFFERVPVGGQIYVLKHILHDWPDERASLILKNCASVLPADGKIVIIERLIPEGEGPPAAKLLDLDMLVLVGGQERTESEFGYLLTKVGLRLSRTVHAPNGVSIIEAVL